MDFAVSVFELQYSKGAEITEYTLVNLGDA